MYIITRPVNGITLNGTREVLRRGSEPLRFNTIQDAKEFCRSIDLDPDDGFCDIERESEGLNENK